MVFSDNFEDFYERKYLMTRILMINLTKLRMNEKFIKTSFMNSKILNFVKNLFLKIKKTSRIGKTGCRRNGINIIQFNLIIQKELDFLPKLTMLILKFMWTIKMVPVQNKLIWNFKNMSKEKKKTYSFDKSLFQKKAILKFLLFFYRKKKIQINILLKLIFFSFFEYKGICNF